MPRRLRKRENTMSEQIKVVRVVSTGALIPLHDNNRIILQREGVVESLAERCPDTGKLIEINGADYSTMVSASNDLKRIGDALINNRRQRDQLIAAAIRQPGGEQFIQTIGVLDDELYVQHVDPETLQLPAHVQTVQCKPAYHSNHNAHQRL